MKLHEFGIRDDRACACGHAQSFAAQLERISRDRIKGAKPPGGKDDRRGAKQNEPGIFTLAITGEYPDDPAVLDGQFQRMETLPDLDGRACQRPLGEAVHDRGAGAVARDVNDAGRGVRGLLRQCERAVRIAVERRAITEKIVDAGSGLAGHDGRHGLIHDARAGGDRVGAMGLPVVVRSKRRRYAALRPSARPARSGTRARQDARREGRKLQSREQPRKAGSQDQRSGNMNDIVEAARHDTPLMPPGAADRTSRQASARRPPWRARRFAHLRSPRRSWFRAHGGFWAA